MLLRRVARPMLAAVFISGGINALRSPQGHVEAAKPVLDAVSPAVDKAVEASPLDRRPDDEVLVKVDAGVKIVAGTMLALNKAPRLASTALAASLIPTTLAGHRFWEETDPQRKAEQQIHFFKNVGLLGGLMIAAADTEGKPSLGWRGRKAAAAASASIAGLTDKVSGSTSSSSSALGERASALGEKASELGSSLAEKASELGSAASEKAAVLGPQAVDTASALGSTVGDKVAETFAPGGPAAQRRDQAVAGITAGLAGLAPTAKAVKDRAARAGATVVDASTVAADRAGELSEDWAKRAGKARKRVEKRAAKRQAALQKAGEARAAALQKAGEEKAAAWQKTAAKRADAWQKQADKKRDQWEKTAVKKRAEWEKAAAKKRKEVAKKAPGVIDSVSEQASKLGHDVAERATAVGHEVALQAGGLAQDTRKRLATIGS